MPSWTCTTYTLLCMLIVYSAINRWCDCIYAFTKCICNTNSVKKRSHLLLSSLNICMNLEITWAIVKVNMSSFTHVSHFISLREFHVWKEGTKVRLINGYYQCRTINMVLWFFLWLSFRKYVICIYYILIVSLMLKECSHVTKSDIILCLRIEFPCKWVTNLVRNYILTQNYIFGLNFITCEVLNEFTMTSCNLSWSVAGQNDLYNI